MPTFDTIQKGADNRNLVRKIQKAVAFLGKSDVDLPESLYETASLIDFKTLGWVPIGLVSPDGYTFGRETEKEDVDALGYASPVRSDITKVPRTIAFTPLQSWQKNLMELKYGADYSANAQDPTTGEVVLDEPDLPAGEEYKLIVLGKDGPADVQWVMGKGYGAVKLAGSGEETWGQEGAVASELTFDVFTDDEVGVPVRHYLGGTGAVKYKDVLGYTAGV